MLPSISSHRAPESANRLWSARSLLAAAVAVAAAFAAICASAAQAQAATYHLSPAGKDTNAGTSAAPWRSLAKAISTSRAGDTVVVHAGSYGAVGTWTTFSSSGTATAPITFRGADGEARPAILGATKITGNHLTFDRLLFDGPTGKVLSTSTTNPLGEEVQVSIYGDNVTVSRSEVRDSLWHAGIYLNGADNVRLVGNYIHHNGNFNRPEQANTDHGIYFGRGSGLIADNLITNNVSHGVQLYPYAAKVIVAHNTIVRHGKSGVIVAKEANNNLVVNNIVAYNTDNSIRSSGLTGTGNLVQRNVVFGNGNGNLGTQTSGLTLKDNVQANPQFVATTDYRLQTTSPAIDAAITGYATSSDYLGSTRPQGRGPDIGAYEGY